MISQSHYFDTGSVVPTFSLYVAHSKLVNYGEKMIKVIGPIIWNRIPCEIQSVNTISSFKFHLKKHLIANYSDFQ